MLLNRIKRLFWYLGVAPKLGIGNVLYVIYYRLLLKSGILVKYYPISITKDDGNLFKKRIDVKGFPDNWKINLLAQADRIVKGSLPYYS